MSVGAVRESLDLFPGSLDGGDESQQGCQLGVAKVAEKDSRLHTFLV